jgi:hypothetical protein
MATFELRPRLKRGQTSSGVEASKLTTCLGVTTILLSAARNPAARSFVALFAQAQIRRGKSKKASNPAQIAETIQPGGSFQAIAFNGYAERD